MNLNLYFRIGLVASVLLLVWYTYNQGVDAGINKTVAQYADKHNEAVVTYQNNVRQAVEDYNRELAAIRRDYDAEIESQSEQAATMARQIDEARTAERDVRKGIKYVQSECVGIGDDAYSLYKRTRQFVSDPRNTSSEDPTEQPTTN
ncbi:hypothetical protein [Alteromonas phage JH01]|nr:hypothetical protein [Alteromonas phage JH01]